MKECKTMTELSIHNANKRITEGMLGLIDNLPYYGVWFSIEELKLMFPPKPLDLNEVS